MNNSTIERPGAIGDLPLYTYLNFDARFVRANKFFLPDWLKAKTLENTITTSKPKSANDSTKLFEYKVVDALTLIDDITGLGWHPSHIQMMNRTHGGVRVRITWAKEGDRLTPIEIDWIMNVIGRFYFDAMAYKQHIGTDHLPPHVNIGLGNPVERDKATSVFSIQIMYGEPVVINDPE